MRAESKWLSFMAAVSLALAASVAAGAGLEITPGVQAELDHQKAALTHWAAEPAIVTAVKEQNTKGPIAGMDNVKWKTLRRSDPTVKAFIDNPAGQLLKHKIEASNGALDKVFLNAAHGEKVAFAEKTISYLHAGQAKFDKPMASGKAWQMDKPWFDESLQAYAIQVSVPVLADGKVIGVLVGSVPVSHLEKLTKK